MDLREAIHQSNTGDPDETVDIVFDLLGVPAKWRDVFRLVVRDECRRQARNIVRDLETGGGDHVGHGANDSPVASPRCDFLAARFYTGAEYVTWAEATVEQHKQRIAFQLRLRGGLDADIERHHTAIVEIRAAGVSCLGDLEATEVAA